jgi:ficolin
MYSSFAIADESDSYRLSVNGYSGTAGDSINIVDYSALISNGMKFSTFDKDNDAAGSANCALNLKGGWWYRWCSVSDLNGVCIWKSFSTASLNKSQIKLKQGRGN